MFSKELQEHNSSVFWGIITLLIVNATFTFVLLLELIHIDRKVDLLMNHFDVVDYVKEK